MATSDDSLNSASLSVTNVNQAHEYYEELDDRTLDIRKRKAPKPIPIKSVVKEPPPPVVVDPIKELNEQLNRQFRPDLVPPTPPISSKVPVRLPPVERILSPGLVIFDAHAKPVKTPKKKDKGPSLSFKQKFFDHLHQLTAPAAESSSSKLEMPHYRTKSNEYQIPTGMMLVPISHQQQQQPIPIVSQNKNSTINYNNSLKHNKVAPPPSTHHTQTGNHAFPGNSFQSPSSMVSTNPLIQSSYVAQQQQQAMKHMDQSKLNKKKGKNQSIPYPNNTNHSFALYNQQNGRIEGVVKNRVNVVNDDTDESRILDDEIEPQGKWALWLSQPLCLGLTRLSGIILFGSMILLSAASIAGLIASIVLYSQDSVTNAQWKILGMVVCAIMLITIIITLLIFIYCYKNGYMFNKDEDDIDLNDPSTSRDAEGNEKQKAVLRKIYKFNRPNDQASIPSNVLQDVSTSSSMSQSAVEVNDKQTNTETTIAPLRPKDFDRGVWASINAYGGVSYRPLIPPHMVSRFIQVIPHDIDETYQMPQVIYEVVAPTAAIMPSTQIQPRIVQIPAQQVPMVEVIEPSRKQQRTTIIRQPQTQQIIVQQTPRIEYVDEQRPHRVIQQAEYVDVEEQRPRRVVQQTEYADEQRPRRVVQQTEYVDEQRPRRVVQQTEYVDEQRPRRVVQQTEYVDVEEQKPRRIVQQPEYVDVEEQKPRRIVQQPEYEIVEEIDDRSSSPSQSSMEEIVEIVDAPKPTRQRGRKKGKKHKTGAISVKHINSNGEIVENHNRKHYA